MKLNLASWAGPSFRRGDGIERLVVITAVPSLVVIVILAKMFVKHDVVKLSLARKPPCQREGQKKKKKKKNILIIVIVIVIRRRESPESGIRPSNDAGPTLPSWETFSSWTSIA